MEAGKEWGVNANMYYCAGHHLVQEQLIPQSHKTDFPIQMCALWGNLFESRKRKELYHIQSYQCTSQNKACNPGGSDMI